MPMLFAVLLQAAADFLNYSFSKTAPIGLTD